MKNKFGICSKCGKKVADLRVKTELAEYTFCIPCVKEGLEKLEKIKDKSSGELNLIKGFRNFLKKKKLLIES